MLNAKQAAQKAKEYLVDLTTVHSGNVFLEEVEMDESGRFWLITLGFPSRSQSLTLAPFAGSPKEYKVFKVSMTTGEVMIMKIRKLE